MGRLGGANFYCDVIGANPGFHHCTKTNLHHKTKPRRGGMLIENGTNQTHPKAPAGRHLKALFCDDGIIQIFNTPPARLMLMEFLCAAPTAL
jgi:hypothetical protein